jgi:hypothetical protein
MSKALTSTETIPTRAEVDTTGEAGANPRHLCANWRRGCNGVTDGPIGDRLTLCDACHEAELAERGI